MHPAGSLIAFTTLSGLGFGLLVFLGLGYPGVTGWTAFAFFALAYVLATAGLMSSTLHLGHPERALKAFTQWRSSWLSREGWLAVGTLLLMAPYGAGLVFFDTRLGVLGFLGAALSLATVFATAMIYTQLKTIPRWNHWSTPGLFLGYALTGGALLAGEITVGSVFLVILGAGQFWAWHMGDQRLTQSGTSIGTATGLGARGTVRAFEPPHTGPNYLTQEMVHVVGRKHSNKLRMISFSLAVILPFIIFFVLPFSHGSAVIGLLSHLAGVLTARWLFYAEAEHVVGLYYGKR